ncbi:hypothetical protein [Alteromonas facilis]|uniref:hypothetical protein n=1 Tax=Alteromonas facilis TaxID=2048004 RepID=UPI000C292A75|nr:hypothetical protein [Alteromonas facilis]
MKSNPTIEQESAEISKSNQSQYGVVLEAPPVIPLWKTWGLRLFFAGLVFVIGRWQLMSILEGPSDWTPWRGVGHSLLFALAILAVGGMFRPIAFLPVMLFEIIWKAVWLAVVALPLWLAGEEIPGIVSVKGSLIGVGLIIICVPWKYVWWRYFAHPIEPWKRKKEVSDKPAGE